MVETLARISRRLNEARLLWGVGASMLLYFHDIPVDPHDIDIVCSLEDAVAVDGILSGMGSRMPLRTSGPVQSIFYRRYCIEGTHVDLMAGMRIETEEGTYAFDFDRLSVKSEKRLGIDRIPLMALEDWYVLYQLMPGREEKVRLIETEFMEERHCEAKRILRALNGNVPEDVCAHSVEIAEKYGF